jgi:hypothetical protein
LGQKPKYKFFVFFKPPLNIAVLNVLAWKWGHLKIRALIGQRDS